MRQLVIVVSDLYVAASTALPAGARGSATASATAGAPDLSRLSGLTSLMRFGALEALPRGWRESLALWLGREDIGTASPGAVAACAPSVVGRLIAPGGPSLSDRLTAPGRTTQTSHWVWLAEPVHLTASLTSVHLSPQGRLRLDETEQSELCRAFDAAFGETGYALVPTRAGRFLAIGPPLPEEVATTDPARCLGSTIADALPRGRAAGALKRLGAEIEMWLHEHPLNARRTRAGRPPVSTLWLWGGGAPLPAERAAEPAAGRAADRAVNRAPASAIFGDDPFVEGVSHLAGATCEPALRGLASLAASADRAIIELELFSPSVEREGRGIPSAMPIHALEALDRDWIEPALERLARREIERFVVVANDRRVSMMRRDRLKRWRRPRAALIALAAQRQP